MTNLLKETFDYSSFQGAEHKDFTVSYQFYGPAIGAAPIVLVNHALTGNSDVLSEEKGWWKDLIGKGKLVDTERFTVIAFNIPGNGYDGLLIKNYKDFICKDIARIFYTALRKIGVEKLYAVIGGSLGGGIAWEMAGLYPDFTEHLIPIASDWKATDWQIGMNSTQESILLNSRKPLFDARKMAMLFYRTPQSLRNKFQRTKTEDGDLFNVASWLNHHGEKLTSRFYLEAYLMMNQLLSTIDFRKTGESFEETASRIQSKIIQVAIDSDHLFQAYENQETHERLLKLGLNSEFHLIKSIHGHDGFLIEFEKLRQILKPTFNP